MKRTHFIPVLTLACLIAAGVMARAQNSRRQGGRNQYAATTYAYGANLTGEYTNFVVIASRNMFDPTRYPQRVRQPIVNTPRVRVDSFTLVGTMSYEKGQYAFFDSNSAQYQKTLKTSDTIAGYKIVQIAPDYIQLAASSNRTINLPVGTGMRRMQGGPWLVAASDQPPGPTPQPVGSTVSEAGVAPAPATPGVADPAADEALKRLMLRRMQEK
jgi:hypothetical protein